MPDYRTTNHTAHGPGHHPDAARTRALAILDRATDGARGISPDPLQNSVWADYHRPPRWQKHLTTALVMAAATVIGLALASALIRTAETHTDATLHGPARAIAMGWM